MDIPILGALFSSTRWQSSQTELLVVVRPVIIDPTRPRAHDLLRVAPDTTLPAREVIEDAMPPVLPPQSTPRAP
jgi:pilus assembly protein CpaC